MPGIGPYLVAGFLILAAMLAASLWLSERSDHYQGWVAHTLEVQGETHRAFQLLLAAESGARGFLIAGEDAYLAPYNEAVTEAPAAIAHLRRLTADNPLQQRELETLHRLTAGRLAALAEFVESRRLGQTGEAYATARSGVGLHLMDEVRSSIDRLLAEEARLLGIRSAAAGWHSRVNLFVTLGGVPVLGLLSVATMLTVRRRERALVAAQEELRQVNEGLERIVASRTEGLREANEEIQRFAYVVSHDLRAPLVNVMGFTSELEMLREEMTRPQGARSLPGPAPERAELEADFAEAIGFIKASTAKMDRLINAILQLSRQGGRVLRPERIDMVAFMAQVAASLEKQCEERGARIEVAPDLPPVQADRLAVEQVFTNLLENAVKYLQDGRPGLVRITGRQEAGPGGMLVYEVQDNGRGIAPEDQERVFDLFRRAGPQDRPGEGIGLAHVRALIRSMEGTVSCTSTLGQGTTFTVRLPPGQAATAPHRKVQMEQVR